MDSNPLVDLMMKLILHMLQYLSMIAAKQLGKDQTNFIFEVIKNSDSTGISSVEKFLENQTDLSEIKNQLSYPGTHHENSIVSNI